MSVHNARMHSYIKTSRLSLGKEKGSFNIKNSVCWKREAAGGGGGRNETFSMLVIIFSWLVLLIAWHCVCFICFSAVAMGNN